LNAALEEEVYDLVIYCIQNPTASDFGLKKCMVQDIGKELHADGGVDAMENIFYPIEIRIKEEFGKDAKSYRSWWNDIGNEWNY